MEPGLNPATFGKQPTSGWVHTAGTRTYLALHVLRCISAQTAAFHGKNKNRRLTRGKSPVSLVTPPSRFSSARHHRRHLCLKKHVNSKEAGVYSDLGLNHTRGLGGGSWITRSTRGTCLPWVITSICQTKPKKGAGPAPTEKRWPWAGLSPFQTCLAVEDLIYSFIY